MAFEVYHGAIDPANRVPLAAEGATVYWNPDNSSFRVSRPPNQPQEGHGRFNAPAQLAILYVNEWGRDLTIRYAPDGGQRASVPPNLRATLSRQPAWQVMPDPENIPVDTVGANYQARIEPPRQPGATCRFRTSLCGTDSYVVQYSEYDRLMEETVLGGWAARFLVVEVRKRLTVRYYEMARPGGAQGHYSLRNFAGTDPLAEVAEYLAENFAIDLVLPAAAEPAANHEPLNDATMGNAVALPQPANRDPRTLWILAAGRLAPGDFAGLGGNSMATIACRNFEETLDAHRNLVINWQQYQRATRHPTEQGWIDTFQPPPDADTRTLLLALAGTTSPDAIASESIFLTLLHEIGHALGVVPNSGSAGGIHQPNWLDAGHANHCLDHNCAMWWQVETAQANTWLRPRDASPLDGPYHPATPRAATQWPSRCSLYLTAVDLSNLNQLGL